MPGRKAPGFVGKDRVIVIAEGARTLPPALAAARVGCETRDAFAGNADQLSVIGFAQFPSLLSTPLAMGDSAFPSMRSP